MTTAVIIGYIGATANIAGNLMLAKKSTLGWLVRLGVNLLFIGYALSAASSDLGPVLFNHVVFVLVNLYGFVAWKRGA